MKILVLNGPNINLLGKREPEIYGNNSYKALCEAVEKEAKALGVAVDIVQNNSEGELVTILQQADDVYDGVVFNPAAYTHYSIALLDTIKAIGIPVMEVHLSDIHKREDFRRHTVTTAACVGQVCGLGIDSYIVGMRKLYDYIF
ncbi:MAG: type II 3-dehydroquinate dehydratase [Clostridiales bacterium]|nr:type II 3-dehydroquinate dehydratase [Clostridiales bacterium]